MDDDDFIDDTGVDPADRYGSDNEARSPGDAPQVVNHLFVAFMYLCLHVDKEFQETGFAMIFIDLCTHKYKFLGCLKCDMKRFFLQFFGLLL